MPVCSEKPGTYRFDNGSRSFFLSKLSQRSPVYRWTNLSLLPARTSESLSQEELWSKERRWFLGTYAHNLVVMSQTESEYMMEREAIRETFCSLGFLVFFQFTMSMKIFRVCSKYINALLEVCFSYIATGWHMFELRWIAISVKIVTSSLLVYLNQVHSVNFATIAATRYNHFDHSRDINTFVRITNDALIL